MVMVETTGVVTTRVRFLPLILTSLSSKNGTPFSTCITGPVSTLILTFCETSRETEEFRRGRRNVHERMRALPGNKRYPIGLVSKSIAAAEAWDAALLMAPLWALGTGAVSL